MIATSVMVVCFITLLQNPLLGSATWLPGLGATWLGAAGATLLLQAHLPLPDIHRFMRLYPDSALTVSPRSREKGMGCMAHGATHTVWAGSADSVLVSFLACRTD